MRIGFVQGEPTNENTILTANGPLPAGIRVADGKRS